MLQLGVCACVRVCVCVCVCVCVWEGGGFASVMSTVGDYPMLINAHAPSLRLYLNFEWCRETKAFCVNSLTTTASPMNIQIWIVKFKREVLKTLKCATAHWPQTVFLSERVKCPIRAQTKSTQSFSPFFIHQ